MGWQKIPTASARAVERFCDIVAEKLKQLEIQQILLLGPDDLMLSAAMIAQFGRRGVKMANVREYADGAKIISSGLSSEGWDDEENGDWSGYAISFVQQVSGATLDASLPFAVVLGCREFNFPIGPLLDEQDSSAAVPVRYSSLFDAHVVMYPEDIPNIHP